jgi:hypothetical protein
MRTGAERYRRESQNINFMFNNFFPERHAFYEIIWKNMVDGDRP